MHTYVPSALLGSSAHLHAEHASDYLQHGIALIEDACRSEWRCVCSALHELHKTFHFACCMNIPSIHHQPLEYSACVSSESAWNLMCSSIMSKGYGGMCEHSNVCI